MESRQAFIFHRDRQRNFQIEWVTDATRENCNLSHLQGQGCKNMHSEVEILQNCKYWCYQIAHPPNLVNVQIFVPQSGKANNSIKPTLPSLENFKLFFKLVCVCVCMQPKYGGTMFLDAFGPISKSITTKWWFLYDGVMITRLIWKTPLFEKWDERISGF